MCRFSKKRDLGLGLDVSIVCWSLGSGLHNRAASVGRLFEAWAEPRVLHVRRAELSFAAEGDGGNSAWNGYAVWVGIGAAGTLLVGVALFNEPVSVPRFVFLVTLVGSIIGLRLFSP